MISSNYRELKLNIYCCIIVVICLIPPKMKPTPNFN